jgi:hypothetical protein
MVTPVTLAGSVTAARLPAVAVRCPSSSYRKTRAPRLVGLGVLVQVPLLAVP